jgi:hypothetical protein
MQSVTVRDSAGLTATASLSLTITPPLAISTSSLAPATAQSSYNATLSATGGIPPYTWSGTGVDGLALSATGALSGAPAQPGTFMQSVTVRDSAGLTANASLSLTVTPALVISTTSLPPAIAQSSYSATLTASGATPPYIWSGAGADGLILSATGVLSGTPSVAGTFTQTVAVNDSTGATASASLSLTVTVPLTVSSSSLPPATAGTSYSETITASGGTAPYAWSGTGVDGLTFSGTGQLSGTPSPAGSFTQSVTVKDSKGATASASITLTVSSNGSAPGGSLSPILVHAGGPAYTDSAGQTWNADTHFSEGDTYSATNSISNTPDPSLYQTERFGAFSYDFSVPNGNYNVLLKFAEIKSGLTK